MWQPWRGAAFAATLNGTAAGDALKGTGKVDVLHGGGGGDRVYLFLAMISKVEGTPLGLDSLSGLAPDT